MKLLDIYINLIRAGLIVSLIYFIYKKRYKVLVSVGIVFALTFLPDLLDKTLDISLDTAGKFLYATTIVMTMFLGNELKFYDKFAWWDRVIHFISGIVFVSFAIALSSKAESLEKLHILFFCFTYSVSHHALWEVLEYASDCLFHTDNQRWQKVSASVNHASESAIQPAGLLDTMNDTIICIAGTISACIVWWFVL